MYSSNEIDKLAASLCKFQSEMQPVGKDSKGYNFKYASFEDIQAAAYPILSKHDLSISQKPMRDDTGHYTIIIITKLLHSSGQWEISEFPIWLDREKYPDHNKYMQAIGSVISYGKRYSFTSICGIITGEPDLDSTPTPMKHEPIKNGTPIAPPKAKTITQFQANEIEKMIGNRTDVYDTIVEQFGKIDIKINSPRELIKIPENYYNGTVKRIEDLKQIPPKSKNEL